MSPASLLLSSTLLLCWVTPQERDNPARIEGWARGRGGKPLVGMLVHVTNDEPRTRDFEVVLSRDERRARIRLQVREGEKKTVDVVLK